jgi:hypothetical protein
VDTVTTLPAPIFIGGLSYSGKTELRRIIGAHPALCMTRRTYMWDRFYGRFGDLHRPGNAERCLRAMCADPNVQRLAPDAERIAGEFLTLPRTYANLFALVHSHHAERSGARRWGEQLGFVELFADAIFESDPNARMVHMVRDPRDRMCDATPRPWPGRVGWETARWQRSSELATRNERRYPHGYLVLRYEELAARTRATILQVCAFIDEDYTAEMERALRAVSFRPSRRAPHAAAHFVERHAARELRRLGYPGGSIVPAGGRVPVLVRPSQAVDRAGMTAWWLLKDRGASKRARS